MVVNYLKSTITTKKKKIKKKLELMHEIMNHVKETTGNFEIIPCYTK